MGCFCWSFVPLVYLLRKSTQFHVKEQSVKEFTFIFYFLSSHISCDRCAIPEDDMDQDKINLKVKDREEKKDQENNPEVSDKDIDRTNDNKEEDKSKKTVSP